MDAQAVLMGFFTCNPLFLGKATEGYPSCNPDHLEMWEELFRYVFNGESPIDVEHVDYPLTRRAGSTDPRWDTLILKSGMGFGCAMRTFLQDYMNGIITVPTIQEAA